MLQGVARPLNMSYVVCPKATSHTRSIGSQVPVFQDFAEFLRSSLAQRTDGVIISSTHTTHCSLGPSLRE